MRAILPLAVLALLLIGAGLLLTVNSADPEVPLGPVTSSGPAVSGAERSEDVEQLEDVQHSAPTTARTTAQVQEELPLASSEDVERRATFTGRLLDPSGSPVVGALVELRNADFLDGVVFLQADRAATREAEEGWSDGSGAFELVTENRGEQALHFSADGYVQQRRLVRAVPGQVTALGDIELEEGIILSGTVRDEAGLALEGVRVHEPLEFDGGGFLLISGDAPGREVARTDPDGRFSVMNHAAGEWELQFRSDEHLNAKLVGTLATPGGRDDSLVVTLAEGQAIRGVVIGAPGDETLEVTAAQIDADLGFTPERGKHRTEVSSDGAFHVRGLQPDKIHELRLWKPGGFEGRSARSAVVEARSGDSGVRLEYSLGCALLCQVVDAQTDEPLTHFRVEAGVQWRTPLLDEDGKLRTAYEGGHVRVDNLRPRGGETEASLAISAVGYEGYSREGIELVDGAETDLGVIRLEPIPVVRVEVTSAASGSPLKGARVTISEYEEPSAGGPRRLGTSISITATSSGESLLSGDGPSQGGKTDAAGVAIVSSLPGKQVVVSIEHEDHAAYQGEPFLLPELGDYTYQASLSQGGGVVVTVLDVLGNTVAGERVRHRFEDSPARAGMSLGSGPGVTSTDAKGVATFDLLPAGRHSFRIGKRPSTGMDFGLSAIVIGGAEGSSDGWTGVDVVQGETSELTLTAPERGGLEGVVMEGGVALAGAQLSLSERREEGQRAAMRRMMGLSSGPKARSDSSGRYAFQDLVVGEYTLEVSHPTRAMPSSFDVELRPGENTLDPELPISTLVGRITDREGEPIPGIRVEARRSAAPRMAGMVRMVMVTQDEETVISSGRDGAQAETDADGRYELRGVEPEVEVVVEARGAGYEPLTSEPVEVGRDEVRSGFDLVMWTGCSLEVIVTRADGTPADQVIVIADFQGEPGLEPVIRPVLSGGKVTLEGLKQGSWRVSVDPMIGIEQPEPQEHEVTPGEVKQALFSLP